MLTHNITLGGGSDDFERHRPAREKIWELDLEIYQRELRFGFRPDVAADLKRERFELVGTLFIGGES